MNNLHEQNNGRVKPLVRFLTTAFLLSSWLLLPLGLPGTPKSVEAQSCVSGVFCANGSFNVAALVNRIDVYRTATNSYLVIFKLQNGLTGSGSCGAGQAVFNQINGGTCGSGFTSSEDQYALVVSNEGCPSGEFTVGYRVFAYIKPDTANLRKVHGSLKIIPSQIPIGGGITNYAPIPGC
jgi:hypothetical protein